ncbi:TauD/TfdA dioxygenase family protein [Rhizorhabdus dicambivorans]|uniref:Taurine dioxygenase n=1 Tax=Rhizorhabdus dicambivorans TaxID=1850238 RepID=A0A2A4FZD8_9SPHN|nr:TauD/TfdA family dioxygenase [Rhizorhabdus dicambivorans]ATE65984.1 taurine dioxygenase [Rhizorhabdus dicambivorans]PCE43100.1 taurine dioxygenase [Rhizorhabdus dicambivorans]
MSAQAETYNVEDYAETYRTPTGMTVKILEPEIGAELSGVDLSQPLRTDTGNDIRAALLRHGVVFFRNQRLDYERHVELASFFGNVIRDGQDQSRPEIFMVKGAGGARDQSANRWHSDACYQAIPPSVSLLRSITVPRLGGDTCFASAVAAYNGLSDEMKERIGHLRYNTDILYATRRSVHASPERYAEMRLKYPPCDHPVVRIHPETGERTLFVNEAYSMGIVGMEQEAAMALIRELSDEFRRPEYQVRFKWTPDALAIWDNRLVQHYAVANQAGDRYLERITVEGTPTLSSADWKAMGNRIAEPA